MMNKFNLKKYFYFILSVCLVFQLCSYLFNLNLNLFLYWFIFILFPSIFINIYYKSKLVNLIKTKFPNIYRKNGDNFISFQFINDTEMKNDIDVEKRYNLVKLSYRLIGYSFIVQVILVILQIIL